MYFNRIIKLQTKNFRNLSNEIIKFSNGINCIFGENGNGKTNILEAVYFLANRKSFRKNTSYSQILSIECENPEIIFSSAIKDNDENIHAYTSTVNNDFSNFYLDNVLKKRKINFDVVILGAFDAHNFFSSASNRRSWFDHHIGLIDANYNKLLGRYSKIIKFRNAILSNKSTNDWKRQLDSIENDYIKTSIEIVKSRKSFLKELTPKTTEIFQDLFSERHSLILELNSQFSGKNEEEIKKIIQNSLEKERSIGHTINGIHKDDFIPLFDGINAMDYCSLGQQKISFLGLKFAYIELFRYKCMFYPIVLIDDVSGELDMGRWGRLINYLKKKDFQVLITTANEKFREELEQIDGANKIFVSSGKIFNQN